MQLSIPNSPGVSLAPFRFSHLYSPLLFFLALCMVLHLSLIITLVSSSRRLPSRFPSRSASAHFPSPCFVTSRSSAASSAADVLLS